MDACPKCDGDGYLDIMDPDHYGAVIGARPCPRCDGSGRISELEDEEEDEES